MNRLLLKGAILGITLSAPSFALAIPVYDFEYSYGDPTLAASQTHIHSTSNAELRSETSFKYWKPIVGGLTEDTTTPGLITYHFSFTEKIEDAHLTLNMPTFNWSYSEGHNFLFGSTDGVNWQELMEVETPEYAGYTWGGYNQLLPDSVVGEHDIWLQARLYSYGDNAPQGGDFGAYTNTAQLTRWQVGQTSPTFKIGVNYVEEGGPNPVPEPTTMLLFGSGLAGLAGVSRRRKK